MTAIRTEGLTKDFPTGRAVDGLGLTVPRGIVFGFLGPNGAGKTTTIRLLLGLLEPTSGRAEVLGFDARREAGEIRRRAGALLEHPGLYERLSAEDNLAFHARACRLSSAERRERIRELLTSLGLWERRGELVRGWSRGMKQKLAIARAVLHRPSLVFLDEPTAGLDPVAAAALREDLRGLAAREGVTVFLTTHNLVEAEKLCAQVGIIRRGKLLAVGPPHHLAEGGAPRARFVGRGFTPEALERVRARPEVVSTKLGQDSLVVELAGEASLAPLVTLLVGAGVELEEVRRSRPTLEEVFLAFMDEDAE